REIPLKALELKPPRLLTSARAHTHTHTHTHTHKTITIQSYNRVTQTLRNNHVALPKPYHHHHHHHHHHHIDPLCCAMCQRRNYHAVHVVVSHVNRGCLMSSVKQLLCSQN